MPNRRNFLKQTSFAAAAWMVTKPAWFADEQLIGLQLYTVRSEMAKDVKATVAKVAATGYNSVEVFGYANGKFFGLTPEEFSTIIKSNNLKSPSGHYVMPAFLKSGNEDELKRTVADAAKMGHEFFVVPYLTEDLRTSLDDYKKLAKNLNRAGEEAKSAGMQLAYHNHDFEFKDWGSGKTGFEIILKETDPKLVSLETDMYWVTKAGVDPVQFIKANAGRIKMWHIKDMDNTGEKSFTEVGSGVINYKEIFKYKKESGMKYFFVEQDQTKIPVYESISKSFQYIKNNILS